MRELLEVKNLHTHFPGKDQTVRAVNGATFTVHEGETFGLVGESGCGKSMTCRSIIGLLKKPGEVVEGEILFKGEDLLKKTNNEMNRIRGREIGMIFQEPMTALNPLMRIKDQIYDALDPAKYKTKGQKYARALEMMQLVGIPSPEMRLEEYPHQFSGGMRQRAMIAIALASGLQLLLADEPTTALDVTIQDQVMKLILDLRDELNMSVILITHDLSVVAQMCDRVAVMYAGQIVEMTDTVTLFETPRHPYTYALMSSLPGSGKKKERLETIQGAPPDLANLPEGCAFEPRCRYAQEVCKRTAPPLVALGEGHEARCHFAAENDFHGPAAKPEGEEGNANE